MNTFADRSLAVQHSLAKLFTFRWQFTVSKYEYSHLAVAVYKDQNDLLFQSPSPMPSTF